MAVIESVFLSKMAQLQRGNWECIPGSSKKIPYIYWSSGEPFKEFNQYVRYRTEGYSGIDVQTAVSMAKHLVHYANWLEEAGISWMHFPIKRKDRCIFRYRGYLIQERNNGSIAPSTTSARMNAVLAFYRYAYSEKLIQSEDGSMLWNDRFRKIHYENTEGFSRTIRVMSSELSIPNRTRKQDTLENGLMPLEKSNKHLLLEYLSNSNKELFLMHLISLTTGARSETVRTLSKDAIQNCIESLTNRDIYEMSVGPGTGVETKNDVSGIINLPKKLHTLLLAYSKSTRRLVRESVSIAKNKHYLFLTKNGAPYSDSSFNALIARLRKDLVEKGYTQFKKYRFHQCRATFGTELMVMQLNNNVRPADAINFVKNALLHANESTTWRYIKFIQSNSTREIFNKDFHDFLTNQADDGQFLEKVTGYYE